MTLNLQVTFRRCAPTKNLLLLALSIALGRDELVDYNLVYLVSKVFQLRSSPKVFTTSMCGQQQISSIVGLILSNPSPEIIFESSLCCWAARYEAGLVDILTFFGLIMSRPVPSIYGIKRFQQHTGLCAESVVTLLKRYAIACKPYDGIYKVCRRHIYMHTS